MNTFNFIGRWTKQPELRFTPNGKAVASGTVAIQRSFTNQQGEREADFINVVIWGNIAETIVNKTEKGGRIGGVARIQSRSYEGQDGKRVYVTEAVVENVTIIDWANGDGQSGQGSNQSIPNTSHQYRDNPDPFPGGDVNISDDDLPF